MDAPKNRPLQPQLRNCLGDKEKCDFYLSSVIDYTKQNYDKPLLFSEKTMMLEMMNIKKLKKPLAVVLAILLLCSCSPSEFTLEETISGPESSVESAMPAKADTDDGFPPVEERDEGLVPEDEEAHDDNSWSWSVELCNRTQHPIESVRGVFSGVEAASDRVQPGDNCTLTWELTAREENALHGISKQPAFSILIDGEWIDITTAMVTSRDNHPQMEMNFAQIEIHQSDCFFYR